MIDFEEIEMDNKTKCIYCNNDEQFNNMIKPCKCDKYIHIYCENKWLKDNNVKQCDVCNEIYKVDKDMIPKPRNRIERIKFKKDELWMIISYAILVIIAFHITAGSFRYNYNYYFTCDNGINNNNNCKCNTKLCIFNEITILIGLVFIIIYFSILTSFYYTLYKSIDNGSDYIKIYKNMDIIISKKWCKYIGTKYNFINIVIILLGLINYINSNIISYVDNKKITFSIEAYIIGAGISFYIFTYIIINIIIINIINRIKNKMVNRNIGII